MQTRRLEGGVDVPSCPRLAPAGLVEPASLSTKARDLLRDALETHEDLALAEIAARRERALDRSRALSHAAVWRARRAKRR